ncbi:MAG: protein adenylyltransferase SelO family protein, partial [Candidatus Eremiobacteraeota bacterium]|nr:protein adenylyltransferase SelO family protein [Candidatus Eremiobacteraeota bacterium]
FLREVAIRTARMIAGWQTVGFQHGVMNTDNMSILGLTLDYGPFGFMEAYDPDWICNHSDYGGRYRFSAQPGIALWNLQALAVALEPLVHEADAAQALACYEPELQTAYLDICRRKLGLTQWPGDGYRLLSELFELMQRSRADYTIVFRKLSEVANSLSQADERWLALFGEDSSAQRWLESYRSVVSNQPLDERERRISMKAVNPKFILRNHLAQVAIERAQARDFSETDRLLAILQHPYDEQLENEAYADIPPDWAKEIVLSCSS